MKLQDIMEMDPRGSSLVNQLKQELYTAIEYSGDSVEKSREFVTAFNNLKDAVGNEEAQAIFGALKKHHRNQNAPDGANSTTKPAKRTGYVQ